MPDDHESEDPPDEEYPPQAPRHHPAARIEGSTRAIALDAVPDESWSMGERLLTSLFMIAINDQAPEFWLHSSQMGPDGGGRLYSLFPMSVEELHPVPECLLTIHRQTYSWEGHAIREYIPPPADVASYLIGELRWLSGWDTWRRRCGRLLRSMAARFDSDRLDPPPAVLEIRMGHRGLQAAVSVARIASTDVLILRGLDAHAYDLLSSVASNLAPDP